ncbi:MAG: ATP-dependent sacrificial sulfur transferase LarE [Candidatus Hadarchaeia archaeon]
MKISEKEKKLLDIISKVDGAVVAFSGGVDSSLLAAIAEELLGERALAVTAKSQTYPAWDNQDAERIADEIGINHIFLETKEFKNEKFVKNEKKRCYHCKKELLRRLNEIRKDKGFEKILEGTNFTDRDDYRPGIEAVEEFGDVVISPLLEAELTKEEIRELLRERNIPIAEKPSSPCLASRIPFGSRIDREKLERIESAEKFLRSRGFEVVRVRDHNGTARIEVDERKIPELMENRREISKRLKEIGYKHVSIDLEGYRTGSLNPPETER